MKGFPYKVPFRAVHCETVGGWFKATLWCHVVLRVFPNASDPGGPRRSLLTPQVSE